MLKKMLQITDKTLSFLSKIRIKIFIGTIVVLAIWALGHDLAVTNTIPEFVFNILDTAKTILLILSGLTIVINPLLFFARNIIYVRYVKKQHFSDGLVNQNDFLRILGLQEENLRSFGYNNPQNAFSFYDFKKIFKRLLSEKGYKANSAIPFRH